MNPEAAVNPAQWPDLPVPRRRWAVARTVTAAATTATAEVLAVTEVHVIAAAIPVATPAASADTDATATVAILRWTATQSLLPGIAPEVVRMVFAAAMEIAARTTSHFSLIQWTQVRARPAAISTEVRR